MGERGLHASGRFTVCHFHVWTRCTAKIPTWWWWWECCWVVDGPVSRFFPAAGGEGRDSDKLETWQMHAPAWAKSWQLSVSKVLVGSILVSTGSSADRFGIAGSGNPVHAPHPSNGRRVLFVLGWRVWLAPADKNPLAPENNLTNPKMTKSRRIGNDTRVPAEKGNARRL